MFPPLLTAHFKKILWKSENEIKNIFSSTRMSSFRINTIKQKQEFVLDEMKNRGIKVMAFKSIPHIYTFDSNDTYNLRGSQSFRQWYIYLQSISSILPIFAFEKTSKKILDTCAAPGGKTTGISAYIWENAKIIAIEKNQIRFSRMLRNIKLQWAKNIKTLNMDALKFFEKNTQKFDAILIDAPCSGEGTFSLKNPRSYAHWSREFIEKKAHLQAKLLQNASNHLESWGYIIYSTCTLNPKENEAIISEFLEKNPGFSLETMEKIEAFLWEDLHHGIPRFEGEVFHTDISKAIRLIPSEYFEGFFIAKIRKGL